jgi:hypothetical protein
MPPIPCPNPRPHPGRQLGVGLGGVPSPADIGTKPLPSSERLDEHDSPDGLPDRLARLGATGPGWPSRGVCPFPPRAEGRLGRLL